MKKQILLVLVLWVVMVTVGYAADADERKDYCKECHWTHSSTCPKGAERRECGECRHTWYSIKPISCIRCKKRAQATKEKRDAKKTDGKNAKAEKAERDAVKAQEKAKAEAEKKEKIEAEKKAKEETENKTDKNSENETINEDELRAKIEAELREKIKNENE